MNTVIFKLYRLDYSFFEFFIRDPVAQVVEQRPFKADVEGSSPSWVTLFPFFTFYPIFMYIKLH